MTEVNSRSWETNGRKNEFQSTAENWQRDAADVTCFGRSRDDGLGKLGRKRVQRTIIDDAERTRPRASKADVES